MGQVAENITEETKPKETTPETEKLDPVKGDMEGNKYTNPKGEVKPEENQEEDLGIEISRVTGESQTPTVKRTGFEKRVNKLNQRNSETSKERDDAKAEKEILEEQLKITKIALEQERVNKSLTPEPVPPPPVAEEFDAGIYDPEYQKKKEIWDKAGYERQLKEVKEGVAEEVAKGIAEYKEETLQTQAKTTQAVEFDQKLSAHCERAGKLGAKDYDATEDIAIDKLGLANVQFIIRKFNDSQNILYYYGKNPNEAETLYELADRDPDLAIAEIGRLRSEIKIKPKTKTTAPAPYENLEGSTASNGGKRGPKGCKIY